jgi:hypothetical protein
LEAVFRNIKKLRAPEVALVNTVRNELRSIGKSNGK